MPAERAKDILVEKLKEFGIHLNDDVVAVITDGASVMTKMGTLFKPIHQLCFAHAIHLAVCDVVYNPELDRNSSEVLLNLSDNFELNEVYDNILLDDNEICDPYDTDMVIPILKNHINLVIIKVRRIVKLFRKSSTKNDTLQTYVREIHNGKEMKLILDCKTRWNSLFTMIERFVVLKNPLSKALIDVSCSINIHDYEWEMLEDMKNV